MKEIEWGFEELKIERGLWDESMGWECPMEDLLVGLTLNSITPIDIAQTVVPNNNIQIHTVEGSLPDDAATNMPFRIKVEPDGSGVRPSFIFDPTLKDIPGLYSYTISYFYVGEVASPATRENLLISVCDEVCN